VGGGGGGGGGGEEEARSFLGIIFVSSSTGRTPSVRVAVVVIEI